MSYDNDLPPLPTPPSDSQPPEEPKTPPEGEQSSPDQQWVPQPPPPSQQWGQQPPPPDQQWGQQPPPGWGPSPQYDQRKQQSWQYYDPRKPKEWAGAGTPLTWMEVWKKVLSQPGVSTFHEILSDPTATANRAYKWIFIVGTIVAAASALLQGGLSAAESSNSSGGGGGALCFLIFCAPVFGALAVLGTIIGVGIQNIVAKMFGGTGNFDRHLYAYASFDAPITLLGLIPCVGILLALYSIILNIVAVEAVHQIGWLKATITVFWFIPLLCLCGVLAFMLIAVAGSSSSAELLLQWF